MWFRNWRFYLFHVNTYIFFKWISLYITKQNIKKILFYTGLLQGTGVTFLEQLSPLRFPERPTSCWQQSFEWFRKQTHKCVGWKCSTESSIMNIQTHWSTQSYCIHTVAVILYTYCSSTFCIHTVFYQFCIICIFMSCSTSCHHCEWILDSWVWRTYSWNQFQGCSWMKALQQS